MIREIPDLQVLCLRAVGPHSCSAEVTFAPMKRETEQEEPSLASRLLRRFHHHHHHHPNSSSSSSSSQQDEQQLQQQQDEHPQLLSSSNNIVRMAPRPCIGPGSSRRMNANEVDLNHPIVACRQQPEEENRRDEKKSAATVSSSPPNSTADEDVELSDTNNHLRFQPLIMQFGNPALDYLQSYIDTLVDLGRMDDTRLGIHFFLEWKANVILAAAPVVAPTPTTSANNKSAISTTTTNASKASTSKKRRRSNAFTSKKRRRSRGVEPPPPGHVSPTTTAAAADILALGSLSLHNCSLADDTVAAMVQSGMGPHLAVLDLTGIRGLTDALVTRILDQSPNLLRLSLKNCRKLTGNSIRIVGKSAAALQFLDVGGCFNITVTDLVQDAIPFLPKLNELHASGLLWTDADVQTLVSVRDTWKGLSLGFSPELGPAAAMKESLLRLETTLVSLALPFCEGLVDNALLGLLGRNMPVLQFLDLRGNANLNTITGFYDGRTSAYHPVQALSVLARYTSLSESSLEETRRIHPQHTAGSLLIVYLDDKGMGAGITRPVFNATTEKLSV